MRGTVEDIRVVVKGGRVRLSAAGRPVGEGRIGALTSGWAAKVRGGVLGRGRQHRRRRLRRVDLRRRRLDPAHGSAR